MYYRDISLRNHVSYLFPHYNIPTNASIGFNPKYNSVLVTNISFALEWFLLTKHSTHQDIFISILLCNVFGSSIGLNVYTVFNSSFGHDKLSHEL